MAVTINPADSCAVSLNALATALAAIETAGTGFPAITLSTPNVIEKAAAGATIGTLSVSTSGAWTFALLPGYDANGRVTISGTSLLTTAIPFEFAIASSYVVRIQATRSDGSQFTAPLTIFVTDVDEDGPDPTIDLDLVSRVYNGGTLTDLGAVAGNLDGLGLKVDALGSEYLTRNAMNLSAGGWADPGQAIGITALAAADGFTPIRLSDPGYGGYYSSTTRALAVGEKVTLKVRFKAPDTSTSTWLRINFSGALNATPDFQAAAAGSTPVIATIVGGSLGAVALRSTTLEADGSTTAVLTATATTAGPLTVGFSHRNAGSIVILGAQTVLGATDLPWRQSDAVGVVTGFVPALSSAITNLLQATAWTLALEINANGFSMAIPGALITSGASAGAQTAYLTAAGYTHVTDASGGIAKAPTSGFLGMNRIVLARDGTDLRMTLNGGPVKTIAGAANLGAVIKLLASQTVWLRRLSLWNTKVAGDAVLREISRVDNRQMANPGLAMMATPGTVAFLDEFNEPSYRIHSGTAAGYTQASFQDQIAKYYDSSVNTANTKSDGTQKAWIPRYAFHDDYRGGVKQSINRELQLYLDPQWVAETQLAGTDWGGYQPISFPAAATAGCDGSDYMRMTCQLTANLPAAAQALIPVEQQNNASPVLSTKWKYVSGCLNTAVGKVDYGFNNRFSCRARYPGYTGTWTAWWLYTYAYGNQELDIMESNGGRPGRINNALHRDNFGGNDGINIDLPIDFTNGWHNHEAWWVDGRVHFGVSGYYMGVVECSAQTWKGFNTSKQYMLLNFAIDSGNTFGQTSNAQTDAAMPLYFDVDTVRVLRTA